MSLVYGHVDTRLGLLFEPNHYVSMKQSSPLDSLSTRREISFAGRSAVAGKSEKKTQRRIDSFRFFIPPPMTAKEETRDGLTRTTEQISTSRQQEETNVEVELNHIPQTKHAEPNSQTRLTGVGLGLLHTSRGHFASPRQFGKSNPVFRSFHVAWFDGWQWLHYVEDEDKGICHTCTRAHIKHQLATLMLHSAFTTKGYTNWKDAT